MADPDYFTLAEFRALPDMGDSSTYSDDQILAAAAYFTAIVEREVGEPFIPRAVTDVVNGSGTYSLSLPYAVQSLSSVTVNGGSIADVDVLVRGGVLAYASGGIWPVGFDNVTVSYIAGRFEECPADIRESVMWATRDRLMSQSDLSGIDIRRTSMTTDMGTTTYILPGENRPTGYPDLDAAIAGRKRKAPFFGML